MRSQSVLAVAVTALVFPAWLLAQQGAGGRAGAPQQGGGRGAAGGGGRNVLGRGAPPLVPDNLPFDKHDLSGVWLGNKYGYNATYEPPMTAEGKKKFDAQKPSYGATLGTPAAQNTQVPIGRRRAIPPAQGNDYVGACNPLGLVRLLLYDPAPMEFVVTPNRILQTFEWTWDHREIWLDGRPMAKVEEYLPRWNGYSVGKWDGDTLVVTTAGLDDRQWLDHFGSKRAVKYPEIGVKANSRELDCNRASRDATRPSLFVLERSAFAKPPSVCLKSGACAIALAIPVDTSNTKKAALDARCIADLDGKSYDIQVRPDRTRLANPGSERGALEPCKKLHELARLSCTSSISATQQ